MPENNILRPPLLSQAASSSNNAAQNNSNTPLNLHQLTEQIAIIVREVLSREGPTLISRIINPDSDPNDDIDQAINITPDLGLNDLDKIPDIVKSLRDFSGQPGEFSSWKKSVDRILKIYEHLKGTPKYYGILSIVRNKIIGHADIALESYNTPLNWGKISKCLTLHYADKRDIGTLEYQMTVLVQGNNTIQEFYQLVYQHLSLILNKLSCMDMGSESLGNMTQSCRDKALDTFIRGLKGDLPRLLSIREPQTLPQALHLCLKLQNIDFRTQYANHSQNNLPRRQTLPPPPPPRRNDYQSYNIQQPFYPQLLHNPQRPQPPIFQRHSQPINQSLNRPGFHQVTPFQKQSFQFPYRPQLGYPNRAPPQPTPMEIDRSGQSRQVNYMNRPQAYHFPQKRPFLSSSQQINNPNKLQRIHHTVPTSVELESSEQQKDYDTPPEDDANEETSSDYIESIDNPNFDQPEELEDIYFLD